MARSYSDPSYGSRKAITLPESGAFDGTSADTDLNSDIELMYPTTIQDFNYAITTAGTGTGDVVLGYETAGTGTWTAIGTATVDGTQAVGDVYDGSVTATNLSAGDKISLHLDGTNGDINTTGIAQVESIERFVESDS